MPLLSSDSVCCPRSRAFSQVPLLLQQTSGATQRFSAAVLVAARQGTLRLSVEADPDLFELARVGLGALGVVAEVTLQCVPAHQLLEHTFVSNLKARSRPAWRMPSSRFSTYQVLCAGQRSLAVTGLF